MSKSSVIMVSLAINALLVAIGAIFFYGFLRFDANKVIHNHRPGVCREVEGPVYGSEDVHLIPSEGLAFISTGVVLPMAKDGVERGAGLIYLYDFNKATNGEKPKALALGIKGDFDRDNFFPHGISHWMVDGVIRLFIINHTKDKKHSVEIFEFDPTITALIYKKSINGDLLIRPNDLAAIGPDAFIFTNDGVSKTDIGTFFEYFVGYAGGSLVLYDGKELRTVQSSLKGSNGIAYDSKSGIVYVALFLQEAVNAYKLSKDWKSLTLLSSTPVYTGADNLSIDEDGSVYVGAHPIMHEVATHLTDCFNKETKSSSQVLRLKYTKPDQPASITEIYANDGSEVSGSSVAVPFKNQMLIGTVCRNLVHCEIKDRAVLS